MFQRRNLLKNLFVKNRYQQLLPAMEEFENSILL
jgi:hypothetical protein